MLDKRQIFLSEFKKGQKVAETTCNTDNAFGPGSANEPTAQWWFNKFCKGDESFEDEKQPSKGGKDQLRALSKLILLQVHHKLPKNLMSTILWSFSIWSKLERW